MHLRSLSLSLALALAPSFVLSDIIELKNGGRVEGKVVDNGDRDSFLIELVDGGRMTVTRSQVAKIVTISPAEEEYRRRAPTTADTVSDQWALAMWCREQKLVPELQRHLQRVVELDPAHEEARQLLGFREVDGEWVTRKEIMESRGMVIYDGKYVTPQDVELFERNKAIKEKEFAWKENLERWRRWLEERDPARVEEARKQFRELRDPMSAGNLVRILEREKNDAVRLILVEACSHVPSQATLEALVKISLEDKNEELRLQALDFLVEGAGRNAVPAYVKALKHKDNIIVNRAGLALGSIGDESAIGPLIEALMTEHKFMIGNPGQGDTYSFSPTDGGFGFGGGGAKLIKRDLRNPDVRSALIKLAGGVSFDYDADAWKGWLASRTKMQTADLRRDK